MDTASNHLTVDDIEVVVGEGKSEWRNRLVLLVQLRMSLLTYCSDHRLGAPNYQGHHQASCEG